MTKVNPQSSDDSNVPNDRDADLVAFLRQYAPPVPEAASGEEDRLMAAISAHQASALTNVRGKTSRYGDRTLPKRVAKRIAKRVGIAAGCSVLVYALWQLSQVLIPAYRPVEELAEIENFWFQNWDGVANAEDNPLWLSDNDSGSDSTEHPRTPNHVYRSPFRQE
jgi:hypothetical protein